jgi:hypothetical protein
MEFWVRCRMEVWGKCRMEVWGRCRLEIWGRCKWEIWGRCKWEMSTGNTKEYGIAELPSRRVFPWRRTRLCAANLLRQKACVALGHISGRDVAARSLSLGSLLDEPCKHRKLNGTRLGELKPAKTSDLRITKSSINYDGA